MPPRPEDVKVANKFQEYKLLGVEYQGRKVYRRPSPGKGRPRLQSRKACARHLQNGWLGAWACYSVLLALAKFPESPRGLESRPRTGHTANEIKRNEPTKTQRLPGMVHDRNTCTPSQTASKSNMSDSFQARHTQSDSNFLATQSYS
jgi:hypothetical protein